MNSTRRCKAGLLVSVMGLLATLVVGDMVLLSALWCVTLTTAALALLFARKVPRRIASRVDREEPKEQGFRVTAKCPEVHRIHLGVGEEAFVDLGAFVTICLASVTIGILANAVWLEAMGALSLGLWLATPVD